MRLANIPESDLRFSYSPRCGQHKVHCSPGRGVDGVVNDAILFLVMCLIWTPQHILFVFHLLSLVFYLCPLRSHFDPRDFYFNHLLFLPELSSTYLILLYLGLEHMEQIFLILQLTLDCLKDIFFYFQRKHLKSPILCLLPRKNI